MVIRHCGRVPYVSVSNGSRIGLPSTDGHSQSLIHEGDFHASPYSMHDACIAKQGKYSSTSGKVLQRHAHAASRHEHGTR